MGDAPAVEAEDLAKQYGPVNALQGLSLRVEAGEVFGLLGPNGAGKTTTVEILEGYRRPDSGRARVLGLDPFVDGAQLRPRIGVMLQDRGLYPGLRPLELLRSFAAFYPDSQEPSELLELVGLADVRPIAVRRLSGGQQQRLALALALVGRPSLVFLDEPTAGMDPHARASTWELLRGLRERGVTVVLTTHAMDEAETLCDRVAIIDHGRLVAEGSPSELTNGVSVEDTQFSAPPNLACEELATALGLASGAVRETRAGQYHIAAEGTPALVANLAAWLRDHDVRLGELRAGRRSLEEVFLRVTQSGRS
jgi:ABC-2 type transport system ATP-binding protein